MLKEQKYNQLYMDIATRCSEMSYAVRAKVGAVIVKNGAIISHGWNGMPAGMPNECEYEKDGVLVTRNHVMHAEENAILKATKSGVSLDMADIYVTLSPCINCARMCYGAGIKRIFYKEPYKDNAGEAFYHQFYLPCEQLIYEDF